MSVVSKKISADDPTGVGLSLQADLTTVFDRPVPEGESFDVDKYEVEFGQTSTGYGGVFVPKNKPR